MSIIHSLPKIKQTRKNAKSKNTTCDVDLTIDANSPTMSMNTQPSHSGTGLGLLDYKSAKEERKNKKNTPSALIAKDTPLESMHQSLYFTKIQR